MRRTSREGWLSRLAAKRQKSWVGHPELAQSSNRKTENQTKARRLRHVNAGPNTGPRYAGYCAARGRARILLAAGVLEQIQQNPESAKEPRRTPHGPGPA